MLEVGNSLYKAASADLAFFNAGLTLVESYNHAMSWPHMQAIPKIYKVTRIVKVLTYSASKVFALHFLDLIE